MKKTKKIDAQKTQKNKPTKRENITMNKTVSNAIWLLITLLCLYLAITVLVPYVRTTINGSVSNPPVVPTSYIQIEMSPPVHHSLVA
jgi:hypothetical protein